MMIKMPYGFPPLSKAELAGLPEGEVIICKINPSSDQIFDFIKKFEMWGFYQITMRSDLKYCALYSTKPNFAIELFAEIEKIVDASGDSSPIKDEINRGLFLHWVQAFVFSFRECS